MALTPTVIALPPSRTQKQLYSVGFNLKVNDGATDVIDKNYSISFNKVNGTISEVEATVIARMQEDIDAYKSEKNILDSAALATSVSNIQSGLVM